MPAASTIADRLLQGDRSIAAELAMGLLKPQRDNLVERPWGGDKPWHPFEPPAWEQVAAMMPYTEILFPPGSKYSYSNPGVIFLGRTIEKLSGDPFETYID